MVLEIYGGLALKMVYVPGVFPNVIPSWFSQLVMVVALVLSALMLLALLIMMASSPYDQGWWELKSPAM